jgi:hypothetical protein
MNALYSIPPPVIHEQAQTGLLYASTADLLTWGMALIALAALCLMPGQLQESAKALWRPVGAWIAALCVPCLWACVLLIPLTVLAPILCLLGAFLAFGAVLGSAQELRKGFPGFMQPVPT